jgi:hypothetical protein
MKVILELSLSEEWNNKVKHENEWKKTVIYIYIYIYLIYIYIFEAYHLNLPSIVEFDARRMMSLRDGTLKDLLISSCSCLKKGQALAIGAY